MALISRKFLPNIPRFVNTASQKFKPTAIIDSSNKIHTACSSQKNALLHQLSSTAVCCNSQRQIQLSRWLHVLRPALGIELTSKNGKIKLQKVIDGDKKSSEKNLRLIFDNDQRPPLVILLPWLMSKPKHVRKFVNYYLENGFDVVTVRTTPNQLMWPVKGANPIAEDFVTFLEMNPEYDRLLVHGFSVGGYMWAASIIRLLELGKIRKSNDTAVSPFAAMSKRVQGTIWDSVCDFDGLPVGVSRSIFKPGSMLCNALESYLTYHLKVFYEPSTQYYIRASQVFHSSPIRCPSLLLFSKADPISTEKTSTGLYNIWTDLGMPVYTKYWEHTSHVGHYAKHPQEYIAALNNFLDKIGLISEEQETLRMEAHPSLYHLQHEKVNGR